MLELRVDGNVTDTFFIPVHRGKSVRCLPGVEFKVTSASSFDLAIKTPSCLWASIITLAPPFMPAPPRPLEMQETGKILERRFFFRVTGNEIIKFCHETSVKQGD